MAYKFKSNVNKYKNNIIIKLVSFYEQYRKPMQIMLPIIIIILAGWLTKIIIDPIKFEQEKNYRYTFIKEKLIDIRSAQLAYKEKHGQFTNNFDELINFVKVDSFVLVQKTDTLIEYYNQVYRELLTFMMADPSSIQRATYLIWVAHDLERVADRTTNMSERVIWLVTGQNPD